MFASRSFSGHKDMVLDVTIKSQSPHIVATTSEDKTIRIWDTRIGRTTQCILGFGDFPVENIIFSLNDDNSLFGSTERGFFQFDLRCNSIINRENRIIYCQDSESDICCFDIHPKSDIVSIGCDDGSALIVNRLNGNVVKRMSRVHSNMLGALAFAPRNPNILITGGFDSLCCAWDTTRGRPAGEAMDFSSEDVKAVRENSVSSQISNPPFVHDIHFLSDGRTSVFALGDGSIRLLNTCNGPLSLVSDVVDAHSGMVLGLCPWKNSVEERSAKSIPNNEFPSTDLASDIWMDSFLSCGLDRNIIGWRVSHMGGDSSGKVVRDEGRRSTKCGKKGKHSASPQKRFDVARLFAIEHPNKINAITSGGSSISISKMENADEYEGLLSESTSIGVADVTSVWTLYKMRS